MSDAFQIGDRVQLKSDPSKKGTVQEMHRWHVKDSVIVLFDDGKRRAFFANQIANRIEHV